MEDIVNYNIKEEFEKHSRSIIFNFIIINLGIFFLLFYNFDLILSSIILVNNLILSCLYMFQSLKFNSILNKLNKKVKEIEYILRNSK